MNQNNEQLNLNLEDLNLGELETLTEEASYALPEAGASVGNWFCCSYSHDAEQQA